MNKSNILQTHWCNNRIEKFINYKKFANFKLFFLKKKPLNGKEIIKIYNIFVF